MADDVGEGVGNQSINEVFTSADRETGGDVARDDAFRMIAGELIGARAHECAQRHALIEVVRRLPRFG